jgi:hypothetical protein
MHGHTLGSIPSPCFVSHFPRSIQMHLGASFHLGTSAHSRLRFAVTKSLAGALPGQSEGHLHVSGVVGTARHILRRLGLPRPGDSGQVRPPSARPGGRGGLCEGHLIVLAVPVHAMPF